MLSREQILDAIREAAARNGGRAVGRTRLRQLTGITEYAVGQHWSTYGDAVREAGIEPNTRQEAASEAHVLGHFAALTVALGRVPTSNDLRRARVVDAAFPSLGVFERLGNRRQRVAKALDYCREGAEIAAATILEAAYDAEPAPEAAAAEPGDALPTVGFVYLARGHPGEFKIGRTNLVDRRVTELGVDAAVAPELVHAIRTDDAVGVEVYWHRRFADKRLRGEWFRLSPADVAAFRRWRRIA